LPDYRDTLTQEVRLAIMMFRRVSLAIYMNEITQELLKAVRATAPTNSNQQSAPACASLQSRNRVPEDRSDFLSRKKLWL
jgi:hypothetical protein